MNGFFLQSTTTPRKACKGIESASSKNICLVESDWGKQVVQSAFGIVKHGGYKKICNYAPISGVTRINLGKSRPPP
ncbi:unnamed protein product [Prunus brigantina]